MLALPGGSHGGDPNFPVPRIHFGGMCRNGRETITRGPCVHGTSWTYDESPRVSSQIIDRTLMIDARRVTRS